MISNAIEAVCAQGVANGLFAPGTWNNAGFGQIQSGSFLSKGYYIFQPPVSSLTPAQRAADQGVFFQIAVVLARAVHGGNVQINVG
jgi:hypothetical protein